MYERYQLETAPAPSRSFAKFEVFRSDECINCGRCVDACVYGAHERRADDHRFMAEPINERCRGCFRCVEECPRGALSISLHPDYQALGDGYWKPENILTIWYEAESGKVPVTGAGYRGSFTGPGFDAIWTDMSEIVRPTRDGIHGREYISTSVDLGRKPSSLEFGEGGGLLTKLPFTIEIPIPILFDSENHHAHDWRVDSITALAAAKVGTFAFIPADDALAMPPDVQPWVVPRFSPHTKTELRDLCDKFRILEFDHDVFSIEVVERLRELSECLVSVRVPLSLNAREVVQALCDKGVDVVHLSGNLHGQTAGSLSGLFAKDGLRSAHLELVERSVRDHLTIIYSGGIAAAEHVPKAIICGADAVVLDAALMVALGCRISEHNGSGECSALSNDLDLDWGARRIVNLVASWRGQLLEVLGAMGLREARRLRGEVGRAIFFEDIEDETFRRIFGGTGHG